MKTILLCISLLIAALSAWLCIVSTWTFYSIDKTTLRYKTEWNTLGITWSTKVMDSEFTDWALAVRYPGAEKWLIIYNNAYIGKSHTHGKGQYVVNAARILYNYQENYFELSNELLLHLTDEHSDISWKYVSNLEKLFSSLEKD